jgi:hypothetical protein
MNNFWKKVNKTEGCWLWTGATNGRSYGLFKMPKTRNNITAHRMSYILHNGPITSEQWVLHKCDNPLCVNPDHLFLGDAAANVADMDAKGRRVNADNSREKNGRAVLDADKVRLARLLHGKFSLTALTKIFGVSKSQIHRIVTAQQWATV